MITKADLRESITLILERPALVATALSLASPGALGAIVNVDLIDKDGPQLSGFVDTVSDTFTVTSWVENPAGPTVIWTPSSTPLVWNARLDGDVAAFDVPDTWSGEIDNTWGFLAPDSPAATSWNEGTSTQVGSSFGWGIGSNPVSASQDQNHLEGVPASATNGARVKFDAVFIDGGAVGGGAHQFVTPAASNLLPEPWEVPGKEYSNHRDWDQNHNADPEQVLAWDGIGNVSDTFDYSGSRIGQQDGEVDGIANSRDALFGAVVTDRSYLLFSTDESPDIYYEAPASIGPVASTGGIWAPQFVIDREGPDDVDGVEIWGPEGQDDSNRYTLEFEPSVAGGPRVSVYEFDAGLGVSVALFTAEDIAGAIGRADLADNIDVDAIMTHGTKIMFSIDPIDVFDGGEIWVWDGVTVGGASFLDHGGHLWDTAFDVMNTFGTPAENINALEAASYLRDGPVCTGPDCGGQVPAPTGIALLLSGFAGMCATASRTQRRRRAD